jgi:hypothetical protein
LVEAGALISVVAPVRISLCPPFVPPEPDVSSAVMALSPAPPVPTIAEMVEAPLIAE